MQNWRASADSLAKPKIPKSGRHNGLLASTCKHILPVALHRKQAFATPSKTFDQSSAPVALHPQTRSHLHIELSTWPKKAATQNTDGKCNDLGCMGQCIDTGCACIVGTSEHARTDPLSIRPLNFDLRFHLCNIFEIRGIPTNNQPKTNDRRPMNTHTNVCLANRHFFWIKCLLSHKLEKHNANLGGGHSAQLHDVVVAAMLKLQVCRLALVETGPIPGRGHPALLRARHLSPAQSPASGPGRMHVG
jgi:hypothetical protein